MLNNPMRSALCALLILVSLPGLASAQGLLQGINGSLDLNYSFFSSKTKDASGVTTKIETNTYNPRFTLSINTVIFPKLRLDAGGVFEKNISISKIDAEDTKTTNTKLRPYLNLTLKDPLYLAGIGYSRKEETVKTAGQRGITEINEDYTANVGWKPVGFPSIDTQFIRTNTFDEKRLFEDTTTDSISLTSIYNYKGFGFRYQGRYTDTNQKLNDLEIKELDHSGWMTYANSFLNKRISLSTSYNIARQEVETSVKGTGEVSFQIFPFGGLSALDDTPATDALNPNPALIDSNLTASAGIDIGYPGLGGDTTLRNIGLDFLNLTEVNRLLVWVDRELPSDIANSFSWKIYVSSDNLNWILAASLFSAPFGLFQNRFELNFSNVTARYIKVVTKPLAVTASTPDASSFPDIFITELQAFLRKPVAEVAEKTTRTSQNYYIDVKSRILDIPTLFYDLNYFYRRVDPNAQVRYTLSNGFSVNHRFSRIFSGSARVAREDGEEEEEKRVAYVYNASLEATPLRTLTHRLVFYGRDEEVEEKNRDDNSIFLYNIIQLYKGLDMNLNGGLSFSTKETGEKIKQTTIDLLLSIIPHHTMTLSLDYSYTKADQSGGERPNFSTLTQRGDITVSYSPLRTLFLVASIDVIDEKDMKVRTTQNYGLNWSPFPDGALQFRFNYSENLSSGGDQKDRTINPGLRWNITRRSYLDLSYQMIKSASGSQETDSNFFNANLRVSF